MRSFGVIWGRLRSLEINKSNFTACCITAKTFRVNFKARTVEKIYFIGTGLCPWFPDWSTILFYLSFLYYISYLTLENCHENRKNGKLQTNMHSWSLYFFILYTWSASKLISCLIIGHKWPLEINLDTSFSE